MVRFVVLTGEQTGHNAPLYHLTRLLVESQKHSVVIFGPLRLKGDIDDVADVVKFHDYLEGAPGSLSSMQQVSLYLVEEWKFKPTEKLLGESLIHQSILFSIFLLLQTPLVQRIQEQKPDAIISDSGYPWGFLIAQHLKIPFISSCSSAPLSAAKADFDVRSIDYVQKCVSLLQSEYGIDYDPANCYRNYSNCTLAWTLPELDPNHREFENKVHYFGAAARTTEMEEPITDELALEVQAFVGRTIYVSMGTVVGQKGWTPSLDSFFEEVFRSFGNDGPLLVVLSVGKRYDMANNLPKVIPSNIRVRRQVAQRQILRVVDLFITHGGNNSIHEALFLATPLLVVPVFGDQHQNAQVIESKSLGLQIPCPHAPGAAANFDHVSSPALRVKVSELFGRHEFYKQNCERMQKQFIERSEWVKKEGVPMVIESFCANP